MMPATVPAATSGRRRRGRRGGGGGAGGNGGGGRGSLLSSFIARACHAPPRSTVAAPYGLGMPARDGADRRTAVERAADAAALGMRARLPAGAAADLERAAGDDPDARVRAAALGALARAAGRRRATATWRVALADADPAVRRRAADLAPGLGAPARPLLALLGDDDVTVIEAAAWALGELGAAAVRAGAVPALVTVAAGARRRARPRGRRRRARRPRRSRRPSRRPRRLPGQTRRPPPRRARPRALRRRRGRSSLCAAARGPRLAGPPGGGRPAGGVSGDARPRCAAVRRAVEPRRVGGASEAERAGHAGGWDAERRAVSGRRGAEQALRSAGGP